MSMFGPKCDGKGKIRCICDGERCACGQDGEICCGCDRCEAYHEEQWEKFFEDNAEMLANLRDKAIEDDKNGLCIEGLIDGEEDE